MPPTDTTAQATADRGLTVAAVAQRFSAGASTGTYPTRATIQPNGRAAGNKRLLSLSAGWLLDRGFM